MLLEKIINRRFGGMLLRGLVRLGAYNIARSQFIRYSRLESRRTLRRVAKDFVLELPGDIVFEPTYRCNLKCAMCYQERDAAFAADELSLDQVKYVFTNHIKGVRKVNLIGGEVFLRKDLFEIIGFFAARKTPVHITTNGTLINEENYGKLSMLTNIQAIGVSLDGPEDLHNKMRNSSQAFDRAVRGIRLARKRFFVFLVAVLSDENVERLTEIVETAYSLGLDNLILEFERKYTREDLKEAQEVLGYPESDFRLRTSASKKTAYSFSLLLENIRAAEKRARSLGMKIFYLPDNFLAEMQTHYIKGNRLKGRYFCRSMFKGRVDSRGNVFHCYAIRKSFGNVLDKPLSEIWNSPEYLDFRKRLMGNNLLSLCETCLYMERI